MKKIRYSKKDQKWLDEHERELPGELKGIPRTRSVGTLNDVAEVANNPRQGSDVYIGGEFMIMTGHTKMPGWIEGGPTMPIKQWHRWKAKKELMTDEAS